MQVEPEALRSADGKISSRSIDPWGSMRRLADTYKGCTNLGAATDGDGNYYILQVPPGTYSVRFTMIGYQDLIMNNVRIQVDLTTTINASLSESVIGMNEVVVQAERPMIQTDVTYSQANISSEEVEMLPVEEFEDVIALQAGVVSSNGEIHVRGGRGGEIAYMVDGITAVSYTHLTLPTKA